MPDADLVYTGPQCALSSIAPCAGRVVGIGLTESWEMNVLPGTMTFFDGQ